MQVKISNEKNAIANTLSSFFALLKAGLWLESEKLVSLDGSVDWDKVYQLASEQSVIGLVIAGIERLKSINPNLNIPQEILLQWIGEVQVIEQQNKKLNEAAEHLTRIFRNGGLRSCVLKGQGVARLYDVRCKKSDVRSQNSEQSSESSKVQESQGARGSLSLRRQPGDIDLWVEGGREKVLQFLKSSYLKTGTVVIHHVDTSIIDGVETEVHFLPSYSYNYLRYVKYKKFFKEEANQQFDHFDEQVGFAYPTLRFNAVYMMMHIFRHVFNEGIGLRQLMDYYFVLMHLTDEERKWAYGKLKWLGLEKVTGAVMYIMKVIFQMDEKYLLCSASKETGEFLLEEIQRGGNFGKFGERYEEAHSGNDFHLYLKNVQRLRNVISLCPSEVLWAPVWKPLHWIWRKWKGFV